jgi:hypothetical protein
MATTTQPSHQAYKETAEVVNAFRESSQAVADSIVTLQESTLQFSQRLFLGWIELLSQQAESTSRSQQQWRVQIQKQQEAFQGLMAASMHLSLEWFLAPFSFSRQLTRTAQTTMRQEGELANPFDCVVAALGG